MIHRLNVLLASLWLALAPAYAQVGQIPGWPPVQIAPSGGSPVWTPTGNPAIQSLAFAASTATFSGVAIGTAAANRQVAVCEGADNSNTISGVTVGGISATPIILEASGTAVSGLWLANVPTGTTANVVVTTSTNFNHVGVLVGTFTGITAAATGTATLPYGFNADPHNVTLTIPATSGSTGLYCAFALTPNASPTANNMTIDYAVSSTTVAQILLGHNSTAGSQTFGVSGFNFAGLTASAAAWGP